MWTDGNWYTLQGDFRKTFSFLLSTANISYKDQANHFWDQTLFP